MFTISRNRPITEVSDAPARMLTLLSTMKSTPAKLMASPITPCFVILSFRTIAATIIAIIGLSRLISEASTGVVIVIAFRNDICVRNRPRKDATAIFHRSPLSTFSLFGVNADAVQKRTSAPMARIQKSAIGLTIPQFAMFLHATRFSPKIT